MGLTNWKGDAVRKADVTIAKNYLDAGEIDGLNRIVVMWLDFAEDQARRRAQVFLSDWERKLDEFLAFNERRLLPDRGTVSKTTADAHAEAEYEAFAARRRELAEAEGERARQATLEAAAQQLPSTKRGTRTTGRKGTSE